MSFLRTGSVRAVSSPHVHSVMGGYSAAEIPSHHPALSHFTQYLFQIAMLTPSALPECFAASALKVIGLALRTATEPVSRERITAIARSRKRRLPRLPLLQRRLHRLLPLAPSRRLFRRLPPRPDHPPSRPPLQHHHPRQLPPAAHHP